MVTFVVFAVGYLLMLAFAYQNRVGRPSELWLFAYCGVSAVLMGVHAAVAAGQLGSVALPPSLFTVSGFIISVSLFVYLSLSFIGYEPSPTWLGVGAVLLIVIAVLIVQDAPSVLVSQGWVPAGVQDVLTLGAEITLLAWLITSLALFFIIIRDYLSEPRPLHATRILFWAVLTPLVLLGEALTAWINPPFTVLGATLRLAGAVAAVYAVGASRLIDFRDISRWVLSRVVLTLVMGTVLFGAILLAMFGDWTISPWLVAILMAVGAAIVVQPIYQLARWLLRGMIDRSVADAAESVREYSQRISGTIDLRDLSRIAVDTLTELIQARRGYLILVTKFEESVILEAIVGDEGGLSGLLMFNSPIYRFFVERDRPLLQYDIEYQRDFRSANATERNYFTKLEMDIYAPIVKDDELLGILALGPKFSDEPYRESELDLLAALANQTVAALENARLVADLEIRNAEISALADNLRETNERLERMDAVKSDFIDIASHELRTPLTQIKGYSALLLEMSERNMLSPDETIDIMRSLNEATDRMSEVIAAMLDVSQIDVESLDLNFIETTLANVLKLSIESYSEAIQERNLTLVARGLRNLPAVFADYQRLTQAFQNLVTNAIKFTPDGGKIHVTGEIHERDSTGEPLSVRISIQDTGIGIDEEHRELIFDKFYRVGSVALHSTGTTKFMGAGPGLGLPIAKGIIDAHDGRIWVESEGHDEENFPGSTFHVVLPVRPSAMYAKERIMALREEATGEVTETVVTKSPLS